MTASASESRASGSGASSRRRLRRPNSSALRPNRRTLLRSPASNCARTSGSAARWNGASRAPPAPGQGTTCAQPPSTRTPQTSRRRGWSEVVREDAWASRVSWAGSRPTRSVPAATLSSRASSISARRRRRSPACAHERRRGGHHGGELGRRVAGRLERRRIRSPTCSAVVVVAAHVVRCRASAGRRRGAQRGRGRVEVGEQLRGLLGCAAGGRGRDFGLLTCAAFEVGRVRAGHGALAKGAFGLERLTQGRDLGTRVGDVAVGVGERGGAGRLEGGQMGAGGIELAPGWPGKPAFAAASSARAAKSSACVAGARLLWRQARRGRSPARRPACRGCHG